MDFTDDALQIILAWASAVEGEWGRLEPDEIALVKYIESLLKKP